MILGLDVSTSITGATVLNSEGKVVYNDAWDTRKFKNFFKKVEHIEKRVSELRDNGYGIERVYIEQSLQSFRSGFSSAKTLSTSTRPIAGWLPGQVGYRVSRQKVKNSKKGSRSVL